MPSIPDTFRLVLGSIAIAIALAIPVVGRDHFAVFRSRDGGDTWTEASLGFEPTARIHVLRGDESRVYAGTGTGLYRTEDEGDTWSAVPTGTVPKPRVLAIAFQGHQVFLGTDGHGLLVSMDGGATWTHRSQPPVTKVRSLLLSGSTLYAGTDQDGVFSSQDAGEHWVRLQKGWPAHGQAFALAHVGGRLHAGLYSLGLHRWDADRGTWERVGDVVPLALTVVGSTLIAGHNPGGLHASHDLGDHWSQGKLPPFGTPAGIGAGFALPGSILESESSNAPVWELGGDEQRAIAGAGSGLFRTTDEGRTWERLAEGLPPGSPGIAFWVRGPTLFAAVRRIPQTNSP